MVRSTVRALIQIYVGEQNPVSLQLKTIGHHWQCSEALRELPHEHKVGYLLQTTLYRSHEDMSCKMFDMIVEAKDLIGRDGLTEDEVERVKAMILAGSKGKPLSNHIYHQTPHYTCESRKAIFEHSSPPVNIYLAIAASFQ